MVDGLTEQQALAALTKIRSFYNKILDSEQEKNWVIELKKIEVETCQKAIKEIALGYSHASFMPTVPEFALLCKRHKKVENIIKDTKMCLICMGRGFLMMKTSKELGKTNKETRKLIYEYPLHCICEKGKMHAVDYTNNNGERYYTEPITKYFNTDEIKINNSRRLKTNINIVNKKSAIKEKIKYCLKPI
jgi:hypothetical protein